MAEARFSEGGGREWDICEKYQAWVVEGWKWYQGSYNMIH